MIEFIIYEIVICKWAGLNMIADRDETVFDLISYVVFNKLMTHNSSSVGSELIHREKTKALR